MKEAQAQMEFVLCSSIYTKHPEQIDTSTERNTDRQLLELGLQERNCLQSEKHHCGMMGRLEEDTEASSTML